MRLLVAMLVTINSATYSQDIFALTPDGFRDSEGADYVVFEFEGKTQKELYDAVLLKINTSYVSPKDVLSSIESVNITINGFTQKLFKWNGAVFDVNYTISFMFKDGKVRVNAPSLNKMLGTYQRKSYEMFVCGNGGGALSDRVFIYQQKSGSLRLSSQKTTIENYFNSIINSIMKSVEENNSNDDW